MDTASGVHDEGLRLTRLEKTYLGPGGNAFRLGPVDLTVDREVVAVLGPSGCGKTTLLKLVAGLLHADAGTISLGSVSLGTRPPEARGAALVFQESAVFPHLTARANIAYAGAPPGKVRQMARLMEIEDKLDQQARTLSGGERRRVELARALAAEPHVLLLDEPTTGLDAPVRRRLRERLRRALAGLALPALYVTHDQEEAAAVADRVAVMRAGKVEQTGPTEEIFAHPATPFVARFTGHTNVFEARVAASPSSSRTPPGTMIDWQGLSVEAARCPGAPGSKVWLCIRPEQVGLDRPQAGPSRAGRPANAFSARIERLDRLGSHAALTLALAGGEKAQGDRRRIEAYALPPRVRQLGLGEGQHVRVHIAPEAVHVMPRVPRTDA